MSSTAQNYVGRRLTIKAGSYVTRGGVTTRRNVTSRVTVLSQEPRNGKVRVSWKSHGVKATTLIG